MSQQLAAALQRAPVTLIVAGRDRGTVIVLIGPADILVPVSVLEAAKLRLPPDAGPTVDGVAYVALRSLEPAITATFDQPSLTLTLAVRDASRIDDAQAVDLAQRKARSGGAYAVPSGFLNYSVTGTTPQGRDSGGFAELGLSNDWGHFTATGAVTQGDVRRGLIAYSVDRPATLVTETLGDDVASSGTLGSQIVMGGISYARDFALQPDLLRNPSPSLSGSLLAPARADVYVNGAFYRSVQLQPGSFSLNDLPVPPGANVTQVVVRDATGAIQTLTGSFYSAPSILRQGLSEYHYDLGFLRHDPYGSDDRYGPLAALGSYRVGVTDALTLGATFEKSAGIVDGGPTLDVRLPFGGAVDLALAGSDARGESGHAVSAAYAYMSSRVAVNVFGLLRSATYSTVTLAPQDDRSTLETGESLTYALTRRLRFGLLHTSMHDRDFTTTDHAVASVDLRPNLRSDVRVYVERDRGSVFSPLTAIGAPLSWTVGTSLTLDLGASHVASADSRSEAGRTSSVLAFSQQIPAQYGLGYSAQANLDDGATFDGSAVYRTQHADFTSLVDTGPGGSADLTIAGAIGVFQRGVFFTEPVQSAYGLVHVDGLDNIPVLLNGNVVGSTGKRGDVMIPNLGPYVANAVSLGNLDAVTDVEVAPNTAPLIPRIESGGSTTFTIRHVRIFVGSLAIRTGERTAPASFGSLTLTGADGDHDSDLGEGGEFYFENLQPGVYHGVAIYGGEGRCAFDLTVPDATTFQVNLGMQTCDAH